MLCKPPRTDPQKRISQELDRRLRDWRRQEEKVIPLLLLGTGESGKTTIIKQMKILHINGFSDEEKLAKIPDIKQNIHESIYDIVDNMSKISPPVSLQKDENAVSAEFILKLGSDTPTQFTNEYYDHVKALWDDAGVQIAFQRSNEYQLIDSAGHFLPRINAIRKPDYIPTLQDILFCRVRTTQISKIEFEVPVPAMYGGGSAKFWMYDVGGQRGERKKWIAVFEGITAILFLIAASDFDLTLREDNRRNRLAEAFQLFTDIYMSRFVRNAGLIVFLNKQDLLKRKIESGKRLERYFPEYNDYKVTDKDGSVNSEYERAKSFMQRKVLDIASIPLTYESIGFIPGASIKETLPPRPVYIHFTIATDTNNIKHVFDSVHDTILHMNIDNKLL